MKPCGRSRRGRIRSKDHLSGEDRTQGVMLSSLILSVGPSLKLKRSGPLPRGDFRPSLGRRVSLGARGGFCTTSCIPGNRAPQRSGMPGRLQYCLRQISRAGFSHRLPPWDYCCAASLSYSWKRSASTAPLHSTKGNDPRRGEDSERRFLPVIPLPLLGRTAALTLVPAFAFFHS